MSWSKGRLADSSFKPSCSSTAAKMLGTDAGRPAYIVLMTDGEPTVGETSLDKLLKLADTKRDIRLFDFGVGYENHTSYPAPGQIILYPGGISETEILLAYGGVQFASKMGQLAGNHFITLTSGLDRLPELGKTVLWKGAQRVRFEAA